VSWPAVHDPAGSPESDTRLPGGRKQQTLSVGDGVDTRGKTAFGVLRRVSQLASKALRSNEPLVCRPPVDADRHGRESPQPRLGRPVGRLIDERSSLRTPHGDSSHEECGRSKPGREA
jgi:hypothetical protein